MTLTKNPKISVIVPVYNGEKHISSAIDSLLKQSFKELEIIVVNDGSTDKTLETINHYLDFPNIKIISQKNQGVSQARNTGLAAASGEYIGFLDADDIHQPLQYQKLWEAATLHDADIVFSNIYLERDNKLILKKSNFERDEPYFKNDIQKKLIPYLLKIENPVFLSVCNKIYKKNLLDEFNISFDVSISLEEDTLFNLSAMKYANNIAFVSHAGYHHQENADSVTRDFITHGVFEKVIAKYHLNYNKILDLNVPDDTLNKYQSSRLIHSTCMLFFKCATSPKLGKKEKYQFIEKIISHQDVRFSAQNLDEEYENKIGKFEKLLIWVIKNNKVQMAKVICNIIEKVYSPRLSEILRKMNAKK